MVYAVAILVKTYTASIFFLFRPKSLTFPLIYTKFRATSIGRAIPAQPAPLNAPLPSRLIAFRARTEGTAASDYH
jgi:hypothetical protein